MYEHKVQIIRCQEGVYLWAVQRLCMHTAELVWLLLEDAFICSTIRARARMQQSMQSAVRDACTMSAVAQSAQLMHIAGRSAATDEAMLDATSPAEPASPGDSLVPPSHVPPLHWEMVSLHPFGQLQVHDNCHNFGISATWQCPSPFCCQGDYCCSP